MFKSMQRCNDVHLYTVYCTFIDILIGASGSTLGQTSYYIHIEEQSKKHMRDRHLLEYQPCTSRRDRGGGASEWKLRELGPASVQTSCVGEVQYGPKKA